MENANISILKSFPWARGCCVDVFLVYIFECESNFLFPSILKHWESYQENMIVELKNQDGRSTWSGDGRFDSMGHSAKYGAYTMFSNTISKLVHFELLQVQYRHY